MLFPALVIFFIFLLLSAFFSSAETAFVASNPIKIDYLEAKGSKRASLVKRLLKRLDRLLATILIGNTLVNTAAASVATFAFVSFMPERKNQAVLLATMVTTLAILLFSEISPKTYAAYNPVKLAILFVQPIRVMVFIFYPVVKFFTLLTQLIFPSQKKYRGRSGTLSEEEIKILFTSGVKGVSSLRKKMISGILDMGSRPIREIMVPRPQVRAIKSGQSFERILEIVHTSEFSRFPVFQDHFDNILGIIHAKDIIPYLMDKKEFILKDLLRKPFFVPESASIENVISQMQASANQMVFVVDEFGNLEGIVTLEDIFEELVGEIQDEHDSAAEELIVHRDENIYIIMGSTPIKYVNQNIPLDLPGKSEYTTIAGFFLDAIGKIPDEKDELFYKGSRFIIEKMNRHQISLIRVLLKPTREKSIDENHSKK